MSEKDLNRQETYWFHNTYIVLKKNHTKDNSGKVLWFGKSGEKV